MENLYNNNIDKQYTDKLNEFCNQLDICKSLG